MPQPHDEDDLFKHTTMTFGEHLEELRVSLFKAVVALAIGFGIGVFFAPNIVHLVQSPLENALEVYYSDEAIEFINARVPADLRDDKVIQKRVREEGLIPEERFFSRDELLKALRQDKATATPEDETAAAPAVPQTAPDGQTVMGGAQGDLVRFFVWRRLADDERIKLKSFNIQESFMIWIKAAFVFGAVISSPFVFYFMWQFVAAGLYPHEKRYIHVFLPFSLGLFLCGACLAFFFVFPPVLRFFFGVNKSLGQGFEPRISEWLSFVLMLPLGFGIAFQLPLLMLFLERIHVFTVKTYWAKWRVAVLLMAIASMVLSPGGDPNSMIMMLIPLIGLYFSGIGLCKWLPSKGSAPTPAM